MNFSKKLISYIASLFLVLSFFLVNSTSIIYAADLLFPSFPADKQPKAPGEYLSEFCKKRSGELMNLETWFSGKCDPENTDTFSGESVGFSDIVILQMMEYAMGEQKDDFVTMIGKFIKALEEASKLTSENNNTNAFAVNRVFAGLNNGIIGNLGTMTTFMIESKPATTNGYISYISQNLQRNKIINETYAATNLPGFTALQPLLPVWRAFRNLSYMLFAIAFIMYGIMIMFRVRVDGKTAASIQLAIPKLISTLLIITFSYAIVGLLIDLSTVLTAISINILKVPNGLLVSNSPGSYNAATLAGGDSIFGAIGSWIINGLTSFIVAPFAVFNLLLGGSFNLILTSFTSLSALFFLGIFLIFFLFLAVLIAFFKLTVKLFQAYFSVIMYLIFSPIILLTNVLPGSTSFSTWMKNIVGNLIVFPATVFLLTLSFAFMAQPLVNINSIIPLTSGLINTGQIENLLGVRNLSSDFNGFWTPPFTVGLGLGADNAVAANGSLVLGVIGIGLLLMSSKYVEMIHEAMKVSPFKYGSALAEPLKESYTWLGKQNNRWYGNESWGYKTVGGVTGWNKPQNNNTNQTNSVPTNQQNQGLSNP